MAQETQVEEQERVISFGGSGIEGKLHIAYDAFLGLEVTVRSGESYANADYWSEEFNIDMSFNHVYITAKYNHAFNAFIDAYDIKSYTINYVCRVDWGGPEAWEDKYLDKLNGEVTVDLIKEALRELIDYLDVCHNDVDPININNIVGAVKEKINNIKYVRVEELSDG